MLIPRPRLKTSHLPQHIYCEEVKLSQQMEIKPGFVTNPGYFIFQI